MTSYAPDVEAEIRAQRMQATVAEIQSKGKGLQFSGEAPVADGALLSESDSIGSMQMTSDPGSRDKITLYSTRDGMPSRVLVNMLAKKLQQKLPDGSPAWSEKPLVKYQMGNLKCILHPEHPRRSELDGIGLAGKTCTKSNIPSVFDIRQHMLHAHSQEWRVIEESRAEVEREEEREFRKMQMAQWQAMSAPRRGRPPKEDGEVE